MSTDHGVSWMIRAASHSRMTNHSDTSTGWRKAVLFIEPYRLPRGAVVSGMMRLHCLLRSSVSTACRSAPAPTFPCHSGNTAISPQVSVLSGLVQSSSASGSAWQPPASPIYSYTPQREMFPLKPKSPDMSVFLVTRKRKNPRPNVLIKVEARFGVSL